MKSIVLSLVFVISTISVVSQTQKKMIDYVVAQVGGAVILNSDLENAIMHMEAQGYSIDEKTKCDIFEDLISKKILLHQAKLDSVTVSPSRIKQEVDMRISYIIKQLGSRENLENYYKKDIDKIRSEWKVTLKEQLVTKKMQKELTKDVSITMPEIKQLFSLMPKETLPLVAEKFKYAQIVRELKPSKESIEKIKKQLNEYREQIVNKETTFSGIAVMYSTCPSSLKGGELGYRNRSALDPDFAAVAFRLKKGEISRVVKSSFGYHIIQMIERKGDRINVRHILLNPKVSDTQIEKQTKILDSIVIGINDNKITFADAAKYYSSDEDTKSNGGLAINRDGSMWFKKLDLVKEEKNTITDLNINEISKPFITENRNKIKTIKIVKLIAKVPSHKLNYEDDYLAVKNQALARKKERVIKDWVESKFKSTYIRIDNDHKACPFLKERGIL